MQFSSFTLLISSLAFSAQAGPIEDNFTPKQGINQYGVHDIGLNNYFYEKNMKPKEPLEIQNLECYNGATECLGGPNYRKCVENKWVKAKCPYEVQTCRMGVMSNSCSEY